jgi:2-hydroxychromene-2-carboxylate isomerase
MRIEAAAAEAGIDVRWRPFLLGPIFKAHGWSDSPFNVLPVKGAYMWRDLERICGAIGVPLRRPIPFPQRSVTAARIALIAHNEGWGIAFTKRVYTAQFGEGRDIGQGDTLTRILQELGHSPDATLERAESPENKARLRAETDEAQRLGIFGAPTFITEDGELFWGNDRLEQALVWAAER